MSTEYIDKLAFIYLLDKKILVTLSRGKDVWYIPGGKRELSETDEQTLIREVQEELSVDIVPETIELYGVFEAQAHGRPAGTIVRMTCYTAEFDGELLPSSEIEKVDFFSYDQKQLTSPVDHLIFDDLKENELIE
jgi:8-oxo-dGTP diphosphatase